MNDENNETNPKIDLNLDLSLGVSLEPNPVVEQSQGRFMQLLRSVVPPNIQSSPLPSSFENSTSVINAWYESAPAQAPSPLPPSVPAAAPSPYPPLLPPPQVTQNGTGTLPIPRRGRPPYQARRNNSSRTGAVERNVGDKEIVPPYLWATNKPAVIQTRTDLLSKDINVITGEVQCRSCDKTQTLAYNLTEKFGELSKYIKDNKEVLRQRAPPIWTNPKLIPCETCQNGMKPVICANKEEINWLFLLLGQMLGCCTLEQLRFFCESTRQHRTGAKDRVLYSTYLGLCKQLDPDGPFSL